ncbi:hypothetical protein D3C85_1091470 [compost metagenome]
MGAHITGLEDGQGTEEQGGQADAYQPLAPEGQAAAAGKGTVGSAGHVLGLALEGSATALELGVPVQGVWARGMRVLWR